METCVDYINSSSDGRNIKKCLERTFVVYEKAEPLIFTSHFHGWDWTKYAQIVLSSTTTSTTPVSSTPYIPEFEGELILVTELLLEYSRTYTFFDLVNKNYPKGIDTSKLEDFLADEEFEGVFGTSKDEFRKYPIWKQQKEKRQRGLF